MVQDLAAHPEGSVLLREVAAAGEGVAAASVSSSTEGIRSRLKFGTSRAVRGTTQPCIPKAQSWARSYYSTPARPLLNLSQGVPGDPPHPDLLEALSRASSDPASAQYGGILGEEELRVGMAEEARDIYLWEGPGSSEAVGEVDGVGVRMENVAITSGCNQALLSTMMALTDPGDSILLPCPWYFNILMTTQLLSLRVIPLPTDPENGFTPSVQVARGLIDETTKAIVLVTPSNPCGTVLGPELLEQYFELCAEKGIALILDETYRDFVRPVVPPSTTSNTTSATNPRGRPHSLFSRSDWSSTLISLMSFSKSYKIPGHRLGGIVAGQEVLSEVTTVMDCMQICAPRPPQIALAPLLASLRADLISTSERIHNRLLLFSQVITSVPGWSVASSGGFYSFVAHPYAGVPSEAVSERLAKECGVLTLPGAWFMPERGTEEWAGLERRGSPLVQDKWIRFAVANVDDETVEKLGERLLELNRIMSNKAS